MGTLGVIIAGVSVFLAGKFLERFVLEPIHDQRKVIADIAFALVFYANVGPGTHPDKKIEEASVTGRKLASELRATLWTIPKYELFARLNIIHSQYAVLEASAHLIGWSNSRSGSFGRDQSDQIAELLGLQLWSVSIPKPEPSNDPDADGEKEI